MELIYRDTNNEDIGVLNGFDFDLAFGKNENDFLFTMPLKRHCCEKGYKLYVEGTEYGGIIDKIKINTKKQVIEYGGRTWHGILDGKIITPPLGYDYYTALSTAAYTMRALITSAGLQDVFTVIDGDSINTTGYKFERYTTLYQGLYKMLLAHDAKLYMGFNGVTGKVDIAAVENRNYSLDEEWDSDQFDFEIEKDYAPVNHLVCLGQGELRNRRVIHLFTDEYGTVQNYYSASCPKLADGTPKPTNDTHYNLTTSEQVLYGEQEVAAKYDNSNVGTVETYVELTSKPAKWEANYSKYFYRDDNGDYSRVESETTTTKAALTSKPADWDKNYSKYCTADGEPVQGTTTNIYTAYPKGKKPADWQTGYSNYYLSDGTGGYSQVGAASQTKYIPLTSKPSDWDTNYSNYYVIEYTRYYYHYPRPTFKPNFYYMSNRYETRMLDAKPSAWDMKDTDPYIVNMEIEFFTYSKRYSKVSSKVAFVAGKFYAKTSESVPPTWQSEWQYYTKSVKGVAPTWTSGTYYQVTTTIGAPSFTATTYYELQEDHYADLVDNALEKIAAIWDCDSLKTSFEATENFYDIGDIVGARENTTGIFVAQPITKKIVTITEKTIKIKYEIGG